MSLEDELDIPASATLQPSSNNRQVAHLETRMGGDLAAALTTTIPISSATCNRPHGRCLLVGRQAAIADLRIQHGSISRQHAVFYYDCPAADGAGGASNASDKSIQPAVELILQDLGSKHGVKINQQRLPPRTKTILKDGDEIVFGNVRETTFVVQFSDTVREPGEQVVKSTTQSERIKSAFASEPAKNVITSTIRLDQERLQQAGHGLEGRAKRQAEIAAMMESLDDQPTYQTYTDSTAPTNDPTDEDQQQFANHAIQTVANQYQLPIAERLNLPSETDRRHTVTCIAMDPAGSRFVVGSTDSRVRFYDFGGMDRTRCEAFQTVLPDEGQLLVDLAYSNTGDRILVGTSSVQPLVLDRDGTEVIKFVRGDMYVTDQTKTVGHTAAVTSVDWHPLERDTVLTASLDGSARLWNLNGRTQFQMLVCDKVFAAKNVRGQRTSVTAVCFHPGGRELALGTSCGSIQVWNRARLSGRPERALFHAHGVDRPITCLVYNVDGSRLASRSANDNTIKVWNAQRMSQSSVPIVICLNIETVHEKSNVAFNSNGTILCAGASFTTAQGDKRVENGRLNFYNIPSTSSSSSSASGESILPVLSLDLGQTVPIITQWHSKLNQIFVGCADGGTFILYDPKYSSKGALLPTARAARGVDALSELLKSKAPKGSAAITGEIIAPFAVARNRQKPSESKRRREERKDPVKSKEPERPASGKHKAGAQEGATLTFQQFVADQHVGKAKVIAGNDPREALFQYTEGKSFVDSAYDGNVSKLADTTAEEEEEQMRKKSKGS